MNDGVFKDNGYNLTKQEDEKLKQFRKDVAVGAVEAVAGDDDDGIVHSSSSEDVAHIVYENEHSGANS